MAGYILMISEIKLKESTALNGNIDPDYILPYIKISQRKYMEIKLGTKLYNHILELIKTGDIELVANAAYKLLLDDYIADCLVQWAFYECIPFLRFKVENGNIYSKTSETGTPLSESEAQSLRSEVMNTAEFYQGRLISFLCANNTDYPEYSQNSGCDEVCPDTNKFYSNMNLETTLPRQTNPYKFNVN
tara:strand:+ start:4607 stop:5173 length:567 start_codon:yes stop_codon:yes gene_type:complete